MPRLAKPYKQNGWWVSKAGGFRRLCPASEPMSKARNLLMTALVGQAVAPASPVRPEGKTVGKLAMEFLDSCEVHLSFATVRVYRYCLGRWLTWKPKEDQGMVMGDRGVSAMTPALLDTWKIEAVKAKNKPTTINHMIRTLRRCWNWAIEQERITGANPWRAVKKLSESHRERVITPMEFRKMLRHSDKLFRQVLLFYRLTGLRPSELTILDWAMVDFDERAIVIPAHLTKPGKLRLTRTGKPGPDRIVPLNPVVVKLLRWRFARCGGQGRVFTNRFGKPFKYYALRDRLDRLRTRCGFQEDEKGEKIVLYSTRHSFGTGCAANEVSDRHISELLGHVPGSPVTQIYINLGKSAKYREALGRSAGLAVQGAVK